MDQEEEQQRLKKERAADAAAAAAFAKVEILKVDSGTKSIETSKTKTMSPTTASSSAGGETA